jgi:sigma-B regulation protein RsbU (phosphoserine phosphatase)
MSMAQEIPVEPFEEVGKPDSEPTRVLLVEDDPVSLKIFKKRISGGGFMVETASDGIEGMRLFERFQPHMVISDWMMPNMNGDELCKAVKAHPAGGSVYFILLTARDKHEDIVQALDFGADEYIVKPCDGMELMARLRAAARLLQLQNALSDSNKQLTEANERINKELRDISDIQRCLLPQQLPSADGFQFAAHYQPSCECSGDFYDLLRLDDGRLGIVIGDVSGHGAAAMVAMALLRMLYRMESRSTYDPATFISNINLQMYNHLPTAQYATMFYGILDPANGRLQYCSAGHPPPAVFHRATGQARFLEGCEGFPVKLIGPQAFYENHETALPAGYSMLFYTDGLTETFNEENQLYGDERLIELVGRLSESPVADLTTGLLADLDAFRRGRAFGDDLSLLLVHRD